MPEKDTITPEKLKKMVPGTIFARGEIIDNESGLNINNSGLLLRWIAVRGIIADWAIYTHLATKSWLYIRRYGDKVTWEHNIRKLVPCNDEAMLMYRF